MVNEYGNSGAPEAGVVTPQQRGEVTGALPDRQGAATQLQTEEVTASPIEEGLVGFVAAAEHATSDWLVEAGKLVKAPIPAGSTSGIVPLVRRDGDVWAKFSNGVLVTKDPKVIKWCDEHSKICRRSSDPVTKGWATLKELEARKANREKLLDASEMNADETFPPGLVDNLREQAAKPGSSGDQLVGQAEQELAATEPSVT
jgi:hypothetical protein